MENNGSTSINQPIQSIEQPSEPNIATPTQPTTPSIQQPEIPPVQQKQSEIKPKSKVPVIILLIALIVILTSASIIYGKYYLTKPSSPNTTNTISAIPTITPGPTSAVKKTGVYSNTEQGYQFEYLKSWKTNSQGTLTVVDEEDASNVFTADVLVSTLPYTEAVLTAPGVTATPETGEKTHEEQLIDIVASLQGVSDEKITINTLGGYSVVSSSPDGQTLNYILQGVNKMLLVQFPYKSSRSELTEGQSIILDTLEEI